MKRLGISVLLMMFFVTLAATGYAKPRIYKWVKDKQVSSDQALSRSQTSRVVPISEASTLAVVKKVMTEDLYMALAEYSKSRHRQEAESTPDTVLPEEIVRQREVYLIDEDYRFILEVSLKKYGNRTRVTAKARPVYRIRDLDAEAARDDETTGGNSVEVKINAAEGSGVAVGPIVVAPILGLPGNYGINPLPDAAGRAGDMVKSFMYLLDKRIAGMKKGMSSNSNAADYDGSVSTGQTRGEGSEVEVNIKTAQ